MRGRKTWSEFVKVDIKRLGLVKDDAHNPDKWNGLTSGDRPTLPQCSNERVGFRRVCSRDVKRK